MFLTEKHSFLPSSPVHGVAQVPVAGELSSPEDHDLVDGGAGSEGLGVSTSARMMLMMRRSVKIC